MNDWSAILRVVIMLPLLLFLICFKVCVMSGAMACVIVGPILLWEWLETRWRRRQHRRHPERWLGTPPWN